MTAVKFFKPFLIGLIASLRQASLSLHRAESISELRAYYDETRTTLLRDATAILRKAYDEQDVKVWSITFRLWAWIYWIMFKQGLLPKQTIGSVLEAVDEFLKMMNGESIPNQQDKIDLRLKLDQSVQSIAGTIPSKAITNRACCVEHLGQAGHLKLKQVDEIAGDTWLAE